MSPKRGSSLLSLSTCWDEVLLVESLDCAVLISVGMVGGGPAQPLIRAGSPPEGCSGLCPLGFEGLQGWRWPDLPGADPRVVRDQSTGKARVVATTNI